jgi:23S rRNA (adenine2030-N6)-methyltransferase
MNYRHAFHAGNFADVVKHAIATRILVYQTLKPAPLRFIDTHAGLGRYDLAAPEALRTGEWQGGVGRLLAEPIPTDAAALLEPYLATIGPRDAEGRPSVYPGSPALAQALLRPSDRLLLNELHPEDVAALRRTAGRDRRVMITADDAYQALLSAVPPPERRGLVLIDPPFEAKDEFSALQTAFLKAHRRWATGTFLLWYPIKSPPDINAFADALVASGVRRILQMHLVVDTIGLQAGPLGGCGLIAVNPPFRLQREAETLLPFLAQRLARNGAGSWSARVLVGE